MDSVKDSNNSSKKAMKLLLSVSAISLMFSYSSLLFPFLINSLTNVYVSAFTKQPSSFTSSSTLDKSYVFLLFNGILVIIVKNSGLIGNKSPELDLIKNNNGHLSSTLVDKTTLVKAEQVDHDDDDADDDEEEKKREHIQNRQLSIPEDLINEKEEREVVESPSAEELNKVMNEEEEDKEVVESPSAEEFNRKCEDFIRRVKEKISLEHRHSFNVRLMTD